MKTSAFLGSTVTMLLAAACAAPVPERTTATPEVTPPATATTAAPVPPAAPSAEEARAGIEALEMELQAALDGGSFDAASRLFTEDGVLELPSGRHQGRAGIEAALRSPDSDRKDAATSWRHAMLDVGQDPLGSSFLCTILVGGKLLARGSGTADYRYVDGSWRVSRRSIDFSESKVTVASHPSGAQVLVDRVSAGTTPVEISLPTGTSHQVTISLDGFETYEDPSFTPTERQLVLEVTLLDPRENQPGSGTRTFTVP